MLGWATSQPWIWTWVVTELVPPALLYPCHESKLYYAVQVRCQASSPDCCSQYGTGPALPPATVREGLEESGGACSPHSHPQGQLTCTSDIRVYFVTQAFMVTQFFGVLQLVRGRDSFAQPLDNSMIPGGSPDQGCPHGLWW